MKTANNEQTNGLPIVAINERKNKRLLISFIVCGVLIGGFWIMKDKKIAESTNVEEAFTVKSESLPNSKSKQQELKQDNQVSQPIEEPSKEMLVARLALLQEKQDELQQRLTAPLMLVNTSVENNNPATPKEEHVKSNDPNTQFLLNASKKPVEAENATTIGSLSSVVTEGSIIHATLESATDSDLPGALRAIVSEPTYSHDGSRVLIPWGSRLIGEYKSGMQQGQSRIFIVWNRLITPQGVSINLGSQGVDRLGVAGMGADSIDRHFWQRFGTASLLSMIGAGTASLGVPDNNQENAASSYRAAVANSFEQTATESVHYDGGIAPTLETWQGKPIIVFVAKDLQFGDALKAVTSSVNVF